MRIFILVFLVSLASDSLLSQELFRGENLLVKPPKDSEYKGYHKESGGLKSTTWISNENGTKDTFTVNILSGNRLDLEQFVIFKISLVEKLVPNLIHQILMNQ